MRSDEIQEHLRASPFEPFRVYISDGSHYDVPHPELALVTRTKLIIAFDLGNGSVPEKAVFCDPVHVTRIEPLKNGRRKRKDTRKK